MPPPVRHRSSGAQAAAPRLHVVTTPSATNPNLKAQQGMFTRISYVYSETYRGDAGLDYPSLETLLQWYLEGRPEGHAGLIACCKLQNFTLPTSEADKLLYLLAKLDIRPSAIYLDYHTIVADLETQNCWT